MAAPRVILCGGVPEDRPPAADPAPVRLALAGADANVRLRIETVRRELCQTIPPLVLDLLDVAAYVYSADQAVSRGRAAALDNGSAWRRELHFRVPVRRPEFWADPAVSRLLTDTLGFLSDDAYHFDFRPRPKRSGRFVQQYFDFGASLSDDFEEVVLFSGGLDSLAGAVEEAVNQQRRVVLVNHRSTSKVVPGQRRLVEAVGRRAGPAAPAFLPVWANKAEALGREYTQRTRSFLFFALGAAAAALVGRDRVRFYENGVVSLNLPLAAQVVGARAVDRFFA